MTARTDEELTVLRSVTEAWRGLRKPVFIPASIIIIALIVFSIVFSQVQGSEKAAEAFVDLRDAIGDGIGWWYVLAGTIFVIFALYCAFSKVGNIKLGRDDDEPEFSTVSWFAMLFSAGMGIGLVFYGVAEPLSHYLFPPENGAAEAGTDAAANQAMDLTMYHWGLHAWSIYVVIGLGIAYMTYRKGRPLSVRWLLEPLLGRKRVEGPIGHAVDVIAIVGTLFGIATSLGFGVQQISAGLSYLGWLEVNNWITVIIVAVVTGLATLSVVSGVTKGLKWLSNINMGFAAVLAIFVLLLGPTLFLLQAWVQNMGGYISELPSVSLATWPWAGDDTWANGWTIFYWGWWMSWAPFVGMFIARISRGRTIRQFVLGTIIAPTLIATVWFTIFGDSAIKRQKEHGDVAPDGELDMNTSLFELLNSMPLATITSLLAVIVVVFFFVTSSDSGSLVIDMLATGGDIETPKVTRVYWAVLEGTAAAVLLVVGGTGSLTVLQTASIATAVPFSIVLILAVISLLKAFRYDVKTSPQYVRVTTPGGGPVIPTAGTAAEPAAERDDRTIETGSTAPPTTPRRMAGFSATFAGLDRDPQPVTTPVAADSMLIAVENIPADQLDRDPETGAVAVAHGAGPVDPLGGEFFDTPEFAQSAEGQAYAASHPEYDLEEAAGGSGGSGGSAEDSSDES